MECLNKIVSKSKMRQGESFPLRFYITTKDKYVVVGTPVEGTAQEVQAQKVSILVGSMKKMWAYEAVGNQVQYDSQNKLWEFPLSQEETIAMAPGEYKRQIKIKFAGEDQPVLIAEIDPLEIIEAQDKEVL